MLELKITKHIKRAMIGLMTGFFYQAAASELFIPSQCHDFLYSNTDDREFECCSTISYEKNQKAQDKEVWLKYVNLKFYARIFSQDITVEDLLNIYFSFEKWDEYALHNENPNIVFKYSIGIPKKFSRDLSTLVHKARYTIHSAPIFGQSVRYEIEENSTYVKRDPPASGAIASYDFFLTKNSTAVGLLDKRGYVHVADDGKGNLLLFSRFYMSPRPIANIVPDTVIKSMNSAFENLLKGMIGVDYGCKNFTEDKTID